ncbi:MAG: DEAD/DEAH box helicase [Bacteroidales bacterium]
MKIFEEQGLAAELQLAINEMGFINPTPIQEKVIPSILNSDQDIIAIAQTGTGKTAAFGLPVLQMIDPVLPHVQAVILCPTRELCLQIASELSKFSSFMDKISITAVYGGASIENQIKALKKGTQIVVGTPGRTLDLIKRKVLKISNIRWLILDEADEMLNMGFREDLDAILAGTPAQKQTLLFSATMPAGVRRIAENYMLDPVEISAGQKNVSTANVLHHYYRVKSADRYEALKRIADMHPHIHGIIFCRTRQETRDVAAKLMQDGYNADAIHGDLSQAQRDQVMQRFRVKQLQLLVATDVAARGIDVDNLSHIINYNLPDDPEVYIHRSGRTGRAGKTGVSIAIVHSREESRIKELERLTGRKFIHQLVPGGKEVCEKRLYHLFDKIGNTLVDEKTIAPFMPQILERLGWLDRDELLKRLVSFEFNRFLEYYKDAGDINVTSNRKENDRKKTRGSNFSRMFINLGSKQNISPNSLMGLINEQLQDKSFEIGKIEILKSFSFFEIESSVEKSLLAAFKAVSYGKTKLVVEPSKPLNGNGKETKDYQDKPKRKAKRKRNKHR